MLYEGSRSVSSPNFSCGRRSGCTWTPPVEALADLGITLDPCPDATQTSTSAVAPTGARDPYGEEPSRSTSGLLAHWVGRHHDRGGRMGNEVDENAWLRRIRGDPGHSAWYVERFRTMAAAGDDLAGEARLIDAMVPRGSRILDAGCGPGRVGAFLAGAGHEVVGVDLDPVLIAAAEEDHPGPVWLVDDLATLDLPARGIDEGFDAIVCAGNVVTFLAPDTRGQVLRRLRAHLRSSGRVVVGFGTQRGYDVDDFREHVDAAGLVPDLELSTWSLDPYRDDADFLVAILRSAEGAAPRLG
jgi:SAM-dependent methyltransferase